MWLRGLYRRLALESAHAGHKTQTPSGEGRRNREMPTRNEQMAAAVGQDKAQHEPAAVREYSQKYKNGQGLEAARQGAAKNQSSSTVKPY